MTFVMKDWTQNRADEIANELYDKEFYDLPSSLRDEVYAKAMEDWNSYYAIQIDHLFDIAKEQRLMRLKKDMRG